MANEIKNYRSALAQSPRNQSAYKILIWEMIILSIICALSTGHYMTSDTAKVVSFFIYIPVFCKLSYLPATQLPTFFFLGLGWATPFVYLGALLGGVFYFFAFIVFVFSFVVHYYGITYLNDLSRED
jgi:hypothetical protein